MLRETPQLHLLLLEQMLNCIESVLYLCASYLGTALTHSLTHSRTHLLTHSLTHSLIDTNYYGIEDTVVSMDGLEEIKSIRILSEELGTHSLTHSPTHSLTYSLTYSPSCDSLERHDTVQESDSDT
jgi:hypothetical protein